jgi:hypothetical protein
MALSTLVIAISFEFFGKGMVHRAFRYVSEILTSLAMTFQLMGCELGILV